MMKNKLAIQINYFFHCKYSASVAKDYFKQGRIVLLKEGVDFVLPLKTYHFDNLLKLKNVTITG